MRLSPRHRSIALFGALSAALVPLVGAGQAAAATVLTVTTTADVVDGSDGVLSLREAVTAAAVGPSPVQIVLGSGLTYGLTICGGTADEDANASGDLDVTGGRITIEGNGSTITSACPSQRLIDAAPGADDSLATAGLTLVDLTLSGGNGYAGIALRSFRHLTLDGTTVADATADAAQAATSSVRPGAVYHGGPTQLTLIASTVTRTAGAGLVVDDGPSPAPAPLRPTIAVSGSEISYNAATGAAAAGVEAIGFPMAIDHSRITDNTLVTPDVPPTAAGVVADSVAITDSTVARNEGGLIGGIAVRSLSSPSTVARTTFDANGGPGATAGGMVGDATITDSTFSGNAGTAFVTWTSATITRSTFTGATAGSIGAAGLWPAILSVHESTLADVISTMDYPFAAHLTTVEVENSVVAGCAGLTFPWVLAVHSRGHNYVPGTSCEFAGPETFGSAPTDLVGGGDPMLAPLADNGGPTPTRLPLPGSPLRDRIVADFTGVTPPCPGGTVDQRGAARPAGIACDIGAAEAPAGPSAGAGYHPVPPARVHDSREPGAGPLTAGEVRSVPIAGLGGVPASGVGAVVLNVTVAETTAASHLTVFPAGSAVPLASSLNWQAGDTVANLVTVPLGAGGAVAVRANSGSAQVIVDVAGWFDDASTPGSGDGLTTTAPVRLVDSRDGTGTTLAPFLGGEEREVQVGGAGGIPSGIDAVVVNLTGVAPTAATHLTLWPSGDALPDVSNLNLPAGLTAANLAIVKVGGDGKVRVRNNSGQVDVVLDVFGWFTAGSGDRFHPVVPLRIADTRDGTGLLSSVPFGPAQVRVGTMPPPPLRAALVNATAVLPTAATHLTVRPNSADPFTTSNLNVVAGAVRPNAVLTGVDGSGRYQVRNNEGEVDVVLDLAGWFAPDPGP